MKIKKVSSLIALLCLVIFLDSTPKKEKDPWKEWLNSVKLIMTPNERMVFNTLKTREDRERFKEMFWMARDPNPQTPLNEYKSEFFRRVNYAKKRLRGTHTDRGKIYILLGEPFDKKTFSGYENLVECEIWEYRPDQKLGLVPFINLLFFKPRDVGDYKLYNPGIHRSQDILSPIHSLSYLSQYQAFTIVKNNSYELAEATLSLIPGEGNPMSSQQLGSSNYVLGKIYEVPEKEVELGYIRNFRSGEGIVKVERSTHAIAGYGNVSSSQYGDLKFLNYAVMPDQLNLYPSTKNLYSAKISLYISVEDLNGLLVYQREREIELNYTAKEWDQIKRKKIAFRDFSPIINGNFNIKLAYFNKTNKDFFTIQKKFEVSDQRLPVLVGYHHNKKKIDEYTSYGSDGHLIFSDPRSIFTTSDTLQGVVRCGQLPDIFLKNKDNSKKPIKINDITKDEDYFIFKLPLKDVKDGNYILNIISPDGRTFEQKIFVLPFYMKTKKPLFSERKEPKSEKYNYFFLLAQEYLNTKNFQKALECLDKLPKSLRNARTLPVIVRAYYLKRDYASVVKLFEEEDIKQSYSMIFILANSLLKLKRYKEALINLYELLKYGDTVNLNQLLAATHLVLGQKEQSRKYYEKAKDLENKKKKAKKEKGK